MNFKDLIGCTINKIEVIAYSRVNGHDIIKKICSVKAPNLHDNLNLKSEDFNKIIFYVITSDQQYKKCTLYHWQDCCENVYIEDITGDLADLINQPIAVAEEVSNSFDDLNEFDENSLEWTFYRLTTLEGSVVIRWFGSSNGYYATDVIVKWEPWENEDE